MKRNYFLPATLTLVILLIGSSISCKRNLEKTRSDEAANPNDDKTVSKPNDDDLNTGNQTNNTEKKKLCEIVTKEDLKRITGVEYRTTSSQGDFANIKHCAYENADSKFAVHLTVAFGETAKQRMDQNKQVPGTQHLAGFGDEATWEPAQGTFTARFKNRCVDIKISETHGNDEKRIGYGKEITKLVLERL